MATVADIEKKIAVKLKTLKLLEKDTPKIFTRNKESELIKQKQLFEKRLDEINDLKINILEIMIEDEKGEEEIEQWTEKHGEAVSIYELLVEDIEKKITLIQREKEENEAEQEERRREKRFEEERRIMEMQLEMKKEEKKKEDGLFSDNCKFVKTRLPKLVITPFDGTHLDWFRFWNQFETQIDKNDLPPVSKFSYLKELVIPKVRLLIDSLPFTSEGYTRAKNILITKYGKPSEVANAHVQNIMSLPQINNANPFKIHEFSEKLQSSVQALDTMGKIKEMNGYVRVTLDKLQGIRADLVRNDDDWQDWKFKQLVEALEKWTVRNPIPLNEKRNSEKGHGHNKSFQAKQSKNECVYCQKTDHKSSECNTVKTVSERRKILSDKKLCFNCTGAKHRAAECRSNKTCFKCKNKHHTSICEKMSENSEPMLATTEASVTYPVAIVKVNGVKCRALLDSGSGSSYVSESLTDHLKMNPLRKQYKTIETLTNITTKKLKIYNVKIENLDETFSFRTELNKVEREVLITLPNPDYSAMINSYEHLRGIEMNEKDTKPELPIHVILGMSDYARIKMPKCPRIGKFDEPVAEQTKMGWVIMSPGIESDITSALFTKTSTCDYDRLCDLDVLGIEENHLSHDENVFQRFKQQLKQNEEGWYETGLVWKENEVPLKNNKPGSLGRLKSLVKRLEQDPELFKSYDQVIRDQLANNVIEKVSDKESDNPKEYFMPHRPVIRADAETTKMRVVYDASAKSESGYSLNDCLEKGPSLQNKLWDILIRTRFRPVILCADIQKAFLQIRIREEERDSLKFYWIESLANRAIQIYRFARLIWGLNQSPFILEGTLESHFEKYRELFLALIERIKDDMYVDDMVTGGDNVREVKNIKSESIELFEKGGFKLHKWHSNEPQLETDDLSFQSELNYAKESLGTKTSESKILGLVWDKHKDTYNIEIPKESLRLTKRNVLKTLASIFDPLGFISPVLLVGKILYRNLCDLKIPWDKEIPKEIENKWVKWVESLNIKVEIPRTITSVREKLSHIDIHLFGDASAKGVCTVAYARIFQTNKISQGLIASKSRLAKKNLSIPRLELIAAQMTSNLANNIKNALVSQNIRNFVAWSDSTVVLHWLRDSGEYKVFVSNRVGKIKQHDYLDWFYVPTKSNPADIGSRGCELGKLSKT